MRISNGLRFMLLGVAMASACGESPAQPTDDTVVVDAGPEAVAPGVWDFEEALDTLPVRIGDAQVVGLGESVHTSGGFYTAKDRIIRRLVEDAGFRAVAMETPWFGARLVSQYVESGEGDPALAVRGGLFNVFAGEETLAMVEWLRQWNVDHPDDPVLFYGFDIQQPRTDGRGLAFTVREAELEDAEAIVAGLIECNGTATESAEWYYPDGDRPPKAEDPHAACLARRSCGPTMGTWPRGESSCPDGYKGSEGWAPTCATISAMPTSLSA